MDEKISDGYLYVYRTTSDVILIIKSKSQLKYKPSDSIPVKNGSFSDDEKVYKIEYET